MNGYYDTQDLFSLMSIPVMVLTLVQMRKQWASLMDDDLTASDRRLLMRFAIFVLMPVVVLFHEFGHAAAILAFGGKIADFHYGVFWGYVVPSGFFTDGQLLTIYLAGNVVEVLFAVLAFVVALVATSPPVVACSVYLALTASTGTLIVYTAMSLLGMYGDWKNIYTSPLSNWVFITGLCHGALVALIVYAVTDDKTRTWYACKTTPEWAARYREAKEAAEAEPTAANVLHMAWIYYEGGISKGARRCVNRCKELDPTEYGAWFLEGWIDLQERKISRAEKTFGEIVSSQNADSTLKARALMAIAETALYKIETATRSAPTSPQAYMSVLQAYKAAAQAEPDLADPVFLRARILNKVGLYKQAEHELRSLTDLKWLNPELQALVPAQLQIASEKVAENE